VTLRIAYAGGKPEIVMPLFISGVSAAALIEPAKSGIFDLNPPGDSGPQGTTLSDYFHRGDKAPQIDLEKGSCSIIVITNDFHGVSSPQPVITDCNDLQPFIAAINERLEVLKPK
jgi:hypothetical protein